MGKIETHGVHATEHEWETAKFFRNALDKRIDFIPLTDGHMVKNPDIEMDGVIWEIKAPEGGGKNTIRHNLERAKKQSQNIIIDLRWCRIPDERAIKELKERFELSKRFRRMKIITKLHEVLDFSK